MTIQNVNQGLQFVGSNEHLTVIAGALYGCDDNGGGEGYLDVTRHTSIFPALPGPLPNL